jgi:hypothetical protein
MGKGCAGAPSGPGAQVAPRFQQMEGFAMIALAYLLNLVALVCAIIILIHAFKASIGQGLLSLCIPFYILYYAFARFEHPKKNMIIGVWLTSAVLGGVLFAMYGTPTI